MFTAGAFLQPQVLSFDIFFRRRSLLFCCLMAITN